MIFNFENYDLKTLQFLRTVKMDIPKSLEPLFSQAHFYNRSGVFVRDDSKDAKYILVGNLYIKIDEYIYESFRVFYFEDKNQIMIQGEKGKIYFDIDNLNIMSVDLRRE